jgi:hypothetical protein
LSDDYQPNGRSIGTIAHFLSATPGRRWRRDKLACCCDDEAAPSWLRRSASDFKVAIKALGCESGRISNKLILFVFIFLLLAIIHCRL